MPSGITAFGTKSYEHESLDFYHGRSGFIPDPGKFPTPQGFTL